MDVFVKTYIKSSYVITNTKRKANHIQINWLAAN